MTQAPPPVGPPPMATRPVNTPAVPVSRPIRTPASWAAGVINTATLHRGPEPHLHSRQVQEQINTRFLQHQIPPALPVRQTLSPAIHGVAEAVTADAMAKQQAMQQQLQQRQQQQLQQQQQQQLQQQQLLLQQQQQQQQQQLRHNLRWLSSMLPHLLPLSGNLFRSSSCSSRSNSSRHRMHP